MQLRAFRAVHGDRASRAARSPSASAAAACPWSGIRTAGSSSGRLLSSGPGQPRARAARGGMDRAPGAAGPAVRRPPRPGGGARRCAGCRMACPVRMPRRMFGGDPGGGPRSMVAARAGPDVAARVKSTGSSRLLGAGRAHPDPPRAQPRAARPPAPARARRAAAARPRSTPSAGIQAQYAPSMYVGLWSRLAGFARAQLTRALEDRSVVQATLMRSTIHLVVARRLLAARARGARRPAAGLAARPPRPHRAGDGGRGARRPQPARGRPRAARGPSSTRSSGQERTLGAGLWVDLVRVPPSGTWERRRADRFALAEDWIGPPPAGRPAGAGAHLVRRYLAAFGPASRKDVASFTGLRAAAARRDPARARAAPLRERGRRGAARRARRPLPDPATPAPPRYLPTWDACLLTHARRTGVLPEAHRPKLFGTKTPQSFPSFLVDGAVAGTWRHADGEIVLRPVRAARGRTTRRRCAPRPGASPRCTPRRRAAPPSGAALGCEHGRVGRGRPRCCLRAQARGARMRARWATKR